MVEREVVRKGSSPHRGFLSAHKSSFVSALLLFQPLFFSPLFFAAKSCSGGYVQSFVISDYLNVDVEMIRLEFCSKELLQLYAWLWVIQKHKRTRGKMQKHMMEGDVCGKQGLCVQSQQLRVTSLKAAASRSLRGRSRGLLLRNSCSSSCAEKQLQSNSSCSHIINLAAKCWHSFKCQSIHCTIHSWYNSWTPGQKMSL